MHGVSGIGHGVLFAVPLRGEKGLGSILSPIVFALYGEVDISHNCHKMVSLQLIPRLLIREIGLRPATLTRAWGWSTVYFALMRPICL